MKTRIHILSWLVMLIILSGSKIVIAQGPNGENSNAPTQTICPGIPQPYSVFPGNAANAFLWTITPGTSGIDWTITSGQGTPSIMVNWANPALSTTYAITLTETSTGANSCSTSQSIAVTVNPAPVLAISNPAAVCAPGSIDLTAAAVTAGSALPTGTVLSYWTDAIGSIPLSTPAAVTASGTYYIQATSSNTPACTDIKPVIVTINPLPIASIAYTGSPYCATGTATVTLTGQAGGTYSSTAGLVINAGTGEIDLVASTPGVYTVTYNFSNGSCSNTTTANVTINSLPTASISYIGSPYCATGTATVTLTGQPGGTYSSTTGLTINAVTGDIDLVTSTPGTYTVTYSITSGFCPVTTTTSIIINILPAASIAYSGSPYCATGLASVTLTGQAGGAFSSTPGLTINSSTGEIDLVSSTPGIYTVTYGFTNGTCSNTTTTGITINALPVASIAYSGSPYCATGTATVSQTGQTGGTYSSTAGLVINTSTGEIDLVASNPGTYTVTYTFTNGICSGTVTTSVSINALPVVTIATAGPVCFNSGSITLSGSPAGGTFAGPGMTGNQFDPAAAGIGSHVITYTYSNGTCTNSASITIQVNPAPATSGIWHN